MQQEKRTRTRNALLNAGKDIFSHKGYHETAVSDIVAAAGIAQGSFYNYFQSKKGLFSTIVHEFAEELAATVETVSLDRIVDRESYASVGQELALSLTGFFLANQELARIFYWESPGIDAEFDTLIDRTFQRITGYTRGYVEQGKRGGFVRENIDSELIATAMVGMCSHIINRFLRGDLRHLPPQQIVEDLITIHLHGIYLP